MTTNKNNKFFWNKIQKNFLYLSNFFLILFVIGILIIVSCQKEKEIEVSSLKLNHGWGYTITYKEHIIIKQTIIPAISDNKSFETEKEALAVGQLVAKRLESNLSPTISEKDLHLLKIKL